MQESMNINKYYYQNIKILNFKNWNKLKEKAYININPKLIQFIKTIKLIKFNMCMKDNFCMEDLKDSSELLIIKVDVKWDFGALKLLNKLWIKKTMTYQFTTILLINPLLYQDHLENGFHISKMAVLSMRKESIEEMLKSGINFCQNNQLMILLQTRSLK
jgi:hypothetical protein